MTEQATRAQKGGEMGINGLWYKGGQFLPSTALGKMASQMRIKKSGKQEIAPYVWEVAPQENMRSIYNLVEVASKWVDGKWQQELELIDNEQTLNYFHIDTEATQKLIDLWNSGERWVEVK